MKASAVSRPVVVVEDDPFLRLFAVILDPDAPPAMVEGFADFMAHDVPDFPRWCDDLRGRIGGVWPARVRLVETEEEFDAALGDADVAVVESWAFDAARLARAPRLRAVQKYGAFPRNIDVAACGVRGVHVLTIRRRANLACAEHAFGLMLALARKLTDYANRLTPAQLAEKGHELRPFDRRHTPNGNWARVPGLVSLHGSTLGIIGLGEIGREIAKRARAFDMDVVYHQRSRLAAADETALGVNWLPLDALMAASDWIIPQLPASPATRNLIDAERLATMKSGARIINVSRPDVLERAAIIEALRSGHLGGLGLDPPYASPGLEGDELTSLPNVLITPHFAGSPRFNALDDFDEMLTRLHTTMTSREKPA